MDWWGVVITDHRPQRARKALCVLLGAQTPVNVYFPWPLKQICGKEPIPSPRSEP